MGARVASWHSPGAIRIHQFVGVVRQGDLQLEILPKLDGLSEPSQVRKNLLAMLAATQDLDVRASEVVGFLESSEPFICALARLYCNRLLEAVRKGLRQDYVYFSELLPHIRGKVDWPAQARLHVTQRLDFNCLYDERSNDTPLNRTLKSALLTANSLLEGARVSRVVNEIRNAMDGIADACPHPEQMARLRTDRMNRHLEPLLTLAKLLLGNRNPDLGRSTRGSHDTFAIVWDMNVLFEEYVGRVADDVMLPKGFTVDLQEDAAAYLASEATTREEGVLAEARHPRSSSSQADGRGRHEMEATRPSPIEPRSFAIRCLSGTGLRQSVWDRPRRVDISPSSCTRFLWDPAFVRGRGTGHKGSRDSAHHCGSIAFGKRSWGIGAGFICLRGRRELAGQMSEVLHGGC